MPERRMCVDSGWSWWWLRICVFGVVREGGRSELSYCGFGTVAVEGGVGWAGDGDGCEGEAG